MGCILPGYRLSRKEFEDLWDKCIFVFDANVLLDLYSYTSKVREEIVDTIRKLSSRVWIPHQAAFEYYNNRERVKKRQEDNYKFLSNIILDYPDYIKKKIKEKKEIDEYNSIYELKEELINKFTDDFPRIKKELMLISEKYTDLKDLSSIDTCIEKLFCGKVGKPYSLRYLEEICKEGLLRYSLELPPGFEDKDDPDKKGIQIYGDLILWRQIIEMAKERKLPVIFITNEQKRDWWWKPPSSRQIGPRPELVSEFNLATNELFYMYPLDEFLTYSNKYLKTSIKSEFISEIKEHRIEEGSQAETIKELRQSLYPSLAQYQELQNTARKLISPVLVQYLEQQENLKKMVSPALVQYLEQQENIKKMISPVLVQYLEQQEALKKSLCSEVPESKKKETLRSPESSKKFNKKSSDSESSEKH